MPRLQERFPGLQKERMPQWEFGGWKYIFWWLRGFWRNRPIHIQLVPGTSRWIGGWTLEVQGLFRGAPLGQETTRELPLFLLNNSGMNAINKRGLFLHAGSAGEFQVYQTLRTFGKRLPAPRAIAGLSGSYLLYASHPPMAESLISESWVRPLQAAERLLGIGSERTPRGCLGIWGVGLGFGVTIPFVLNHTPQEYLDLVESFLLATPTLEAAHGAESLDEQPLTLKEARVFHDSVGESNDWVWLTKCPTCGIRDRAVYAYDARSHDLVNVVMKACQHPLFHPDRDGRSITTRRASFDHVRGL